MTNHRPAIDIIAAIRDENILGDTLSPAQESALKALYGLNMTEEEGELAARCAGKAWNPNCSSLTARAATFHRDSCCGAALCATWRIWRRG